jgi:hypothetical protein
VDKRRGENHKVNVEMDPIILRLEAHIQLIEGSTTRILKELPTLRKNNAFIVTLSNIILTTAVKII